MLLLASLCLLATGAYRFQPDQSIEYLLSLTQQPGGAPPGIPSDFDCAWRNAAQNHKKEEPKREGVHGVQFQSECVIA